MSCREAVSLLTVKSLRHLPCNRFVAFVVKPLRCFGWEAVSSACRRNRRVTCTTTRIGHRSSLHDLPLLSGHKYFPGLYDLLQLILQCGSRINRMVYCCNICFLDWICSTTGVCRSCTTYVTAGGSRFQMLSVFVRCTSTRYSSTE